MKSEDELKVMSVAEVVKYFRKVRDELDAAKDAKTVLQNHYDFLRRTIAPGKMEEQDIDKIDVDGIKVKLDVETFASIPAANKETAFAWLREHGMGSLITETVNGSTLKATAKDMLKKGDSLPPEIFKVTTASIIKFY